MPPLRSSVDRRGSRHFRAGFLSVGAARSRGERRVPQHGIGLLGIALAHAVVLSVMITATMTISVGHLNPAVSIGLFVARGGSPGTTAAYILAQLVRGGGPPPGPLALPGVGDPVGAAGACRRSRAVSLQAGHRHRGALTFFLSSRSSGPALSRRPRGSGLRGRFGPAVRHPGRRPADRRGDDPRPGLRAGAGCRSMAGTCGLLDWSICGGIVAALLWEYVLLPPRQRAPVALQREAPWGPVRRPSPAAFPLHPPPH